MDENRRACSHHFFDKRNQSKQPKDKRKMANDSLDDMLGWLDEAMGEKDVHHSPTIAVGRAGSHKPPHYGRSRSCGDEIHHHQTHNNNKTRAPSRRHHYTHHRSPEAEEYRNDHHVHDDRGYQRASSYSAIDSREMTDNIYTPANDGSRDTAESAAAAASTTPVAVETPIETPSIGTHHHHHHSHMFPAMSPIVPQKKRPETDAGMPDDLVLNSPMGHIDLSTPADRAAAEEREDVSGVGIAAPTRTSTSSMLQPRFDMSGALAAAVADYHDHLEHADEEDIEEGEEHVEEEANAAEDTTVDANDGPLPETEEESEGEEEEESEEMSEEERRRMEEEAQSLELARQLMAEEAMASYHHSAAFLRENADQYSQEDLAALEAAVAEEDPLEDAAEDGEEVEMSYDAMLRLGEEIGDVKQERWALVAQQHIDKIPTLKFHPSMAEGKEMNHTEVRCQVCQCEYEDQEELRRLPCGHCFHTECVDQWLKTQDTCCFCKKSILSEEED